MRNTTACSGSCRRSSATIRCLRPPIHPRSATRGEGYTGENVTANLRTVRAIPMRLPAGAPPLLEVRGEVLMLKRDFAALNAAQGSAGEKIFVNPRNAAAGAARPLAFAVTALCPVGFFCYRA